MAAMLQALDLAAREGAAICTFPELAVTGFHQQIVTLAKPEVIAPQVRRLQEACARLRIGVAAGAPTFGDAGDRFNSHLLIDEEGRVQAVVNKAGLTPAEATFFKAGDRRPVAVLQGLRCSAVICREIEDEKEVLEQLPPGSAAVVFWPGQMRPDPDKPAQDPPAHVVRAQALAKSLKAHVVQANWPNALNRPEESANTGHSAVISGNGDLLFRLPREAAGVAVFNLGESSYEWHAEPSSWHGAR